MESETLQVIAAYAALVLSVVVAIERFVSQSRNDMREKVEALAGKVSVVQSFQDRHEGAETLDRLRKVEERQRKDETSLVRCEQKLHAIESSLQQLTDDIRQMDT